MAQGWVSSALDRSAGLEGGQTSGGKGRREPFLPVYLFIAVRAYKNWLFMRRKSVVSLAISLATAVSQRFSPMMFISAAIVGSGSLKQFFCGRSTLFVRQT